MIARFPAQPHLAHFTLYLGRIRSPRLNRSVSWNTTASAIPRTHGPRMTPKVNVLPVQFALNVDQIWKTILFAVAIFARMIHKLDLCFLRGEHLSAAEWKIRTLALAIVCHASSSFLINSWIGCALQKTTLVAEWYALPAPDQCN